MCGIAGIVSLDVNDSVDDDELSRVATALSHRGPDAQGLERIRFGDATGDVTVGLAHRRLSVLDIHHGQQPMTSTDGMVTVVFNGQIYNHKKLRAELERQGVRHQSHHSDTEVLANAIAHYGPSVVEMLQGMFAFAAVDRRRRTITFARDRMGKKPLYLATTKAFDGRSRIAFASELVAFEHMKGARRTIDDAALFRFFQFDFVVDPDCIYQGVAKLLPSHVLTLPLERAALAAFDVDDCKGSTTTRPHATLFHPLSFAQTTASDDLPESALRLNLTHAVDERMVADVPVGVFLSGGLDSGLIAALASQNRADVDTFSIAFTDPSFDESPYARELAKVLKTRHHEKRVSEADLVDNIAQMVERLSEPLADASILPTMMLASFAREHVTVALSGDGGDELFLGYPTFGIEMLLPDPVVAQLSHLRGISDASRRALSRLSMFQKKHTNLPFDEKVSRALDGLFETSALRRHQAFLVARQGDARQLLHPDIVSRPDFEHDGLAMIIARIEEESRRAQARDRFDLLQLYYLRTYLACGVLQKVDRASMAFGLEARTPFLADNVVDFALPLALKHKSTAREQKILLKRAARGLLPSHIIDRKKKGFGIPLARLLANELTPLVDAYLSPDALKDTPHLNSSRIQTLIQEHRERRHNHRKPLWQALCFAMFYKRHAR